ncbi:probable inactive serine/threonine-protein kinase scy2 [Lucilia cuprina]|uniref:probable inactive serine/threonine-protein kinase scy2 n=1 Tax=Lucilia cuprina TaxID=7375 RepID=UPI001F05BA78|nr:probable inactive serine/threonine-protein kinase scy2 [Lucilia cuprina]
MSTETTQDQNIPPPFIPAPLQIEPSVCHVCHESMDEGADCLIIHDCSHGFHRNCIESFLSTQSECPECKRPCQLSELRKLVIVARVSSARTNKSKTRGALAKHYNTRQFQKYAFPDPNPQNINVSTFQEQIPNVTETNQNNNHDNPINSSVRMTTPTPTRPNNISVDYSEINRMIEENLTRILGNLNLVPQSNVNSIQNNNPNINNLQNNNPNNFPNSGNNNNNNNFTSNFNETQRQQTRLNGNNPYPFSPIAISNLSSSSMHCDKITSIIQNWNLKFDGSSTGLHDE